MREFLGAVLPPLLGILLFLMWISSGDINPEAQWLVDFIYQAGAIVLIVAFCAVIYYAGR